MSVNVTRQFDSALVAPQFDKKPRRVGDPKPAQHINQLPVMAGLPTIAKVC